MTELDSEVKGKKAPVLPGAIGGLQPSGVPMETIRPERSWRQETFEKLSFCPLDVWPVAAVTLETVGGRLLKPSVSCEKQTAVSTETSLMAT